MTKQARDVCLECLEEKIALCDQSFELLSKIDNTTERWKVWEKAKERFLAAREQVLELEVKENE